MGDPEGDPGRPEAQQPGRADRGSPARVPRLPRRDPRRPLRRGHDEDLRSRHLRGPQVARQGGHGHVPRRARARQVRAVPDRRQELDDPPDGPAGGPGPGVDARPDRADAGAYGRPPGGRRLGVRDQVGRRARDRLRRGRAPEAREPQRQQRHAALPRAARPRPGAGRARGDPRRRGRGARRRRAPELPAPAAPHAPHLGGPGAPPQRVRAGRLHDLRPAVARRALAAGRRPTPSAARGSPSSSWPARPGRSPPTTRATARGCWRRPRPRASRAWSPSASTARTSPAAARRAG